MILLKAIFYLMKVYSISVYVANHSFSNCYHRHSICCHIEKRNSVN